MGNAQAITRMTTAEFIAWEDTQADKHEFLAGEVYARVGACRLHVTSAGNGFALLKAHLRGGPCRAYKAHMKVEVKTAQAVFYPVVLLTCHPEDLRTIEVYRRMPGGDWLLAASEAEQGLILKSLGFNAAPAAVFEDEDSGDA